MSKKQIDEARVLELCATRMTLEKVGKEMGIGMATVHRILAKHGVARRPSAWKARIDLNVEEVKAAYAAGASVKDVALKLGVSYQKVREFMEENGIARRSKGDGKRLSFSATAKEARKRIRESRGLAAEQPRAKPRRNKPTRLNDEQVVLLREMDRKGVSERERAKYFGISRGAARAASDGETFGHIPIPVCTWILSIAGGANA